MNEWDWMDWIWVTLICGVWLAGIIVTVREHLHLNYLERMMDHDWAALEVRLRKQQEEGR